MTWKEYLTYYDKKYPCNVNDKKGNTMKGYGTVCGYKDDYLILGFDTDYEGCISSFTDSVFIDKRNFKSFRFVHKSKINSLVFTNFDLFATLTIPLIVILIFLFPIILIKMPHMIMAGFFYTLIALGINRYYEVKQIKKRIN